MEALSSAVIDGAKSIFRLTFSGIKTFSEYEKNISDLKDEISHLRDQKTLIEDEVSIHFETVSRERSSPIRAIEEMAVPPLVGQQAASDMQKLLEILNKDDVRSIAVWGKGGIGKTTLVKNLINHLCSSSPNSFNIVIWVQVSMDLNLSTIQSQIAKRLHLKVEAEDTTYSIANRILRRLKMRMEASGRKILLILDDVWSKVDLDAVGIPSRDPCCKILLTTRCLEVCRKMYVDVSFQLNLMTEEDAWNLFVQSAGSVISLDGIQSPARKIVSSCHGLPLAIKTLGKSLRDTPEIAIWRNTYVRWRSSSPILFKNIEKEVFRPLAMSYHSLPSKILQQCFLYCSLYPASFSIDVVELIQCWVSDGIINENQSVEESFNYGVALIKHLKDSCLLDQDVAQENVKMHEIIRDLAILLSQNEELFGFHSQSSLPFYQMPKESSRRVSFIDCKINKLQEYPVYSNLTVLFLQGNSIKSIPDNFFSNLNSLRVLNLSETQIMQLPPSIIWLRELRSLFLRGCFSLTKLPSLEPLSNLRVLDLSSTPIRELPESLGSLSRLRELNLSCTRLLKKIVSGSISGLSSLETLDMSFSAYSWNPKVGSYKKATFDELLSLDHLSVLKIRLDSVDCLASASSWIKKLREFEIQISLDDSNFDARRNERRLVLRGVDFLQENLQSLLQNTTSLNMLACEGMAKRHWLSLSSLMSLTISNCNSIRVLISQERGSHVLFPNLQHLVFNHLTNLETIVEGILPRETYLSSLKTIQVIDCPKLKEIVPYKMLRHVKKLEEIKVSGCENMCCIIESGGFKKKNLQVLTVIEVKNMVKLKTICDGTSVCPMLQQIEVSHCLELKKLPISAIDSCSLKEIRGDIKWWNNLRWENHDDKSFALQHFKAYPREDCSKRQKYKSII